MAPGRWQVLDIGRRLTVSRAPQRAELTASYAIDERIDLLFEVHSCQDEGLAVGEISQERLAHARAKLPLVEQRRSVTAPSRP